MRRYDDWPARLGAFLARHQYEPFAYGRWDCCLFVAAAIEAMTGVDPAASVRGTYSSARGARRYGSVVAAVEAVTASYGMPETSVLKARRGDVALAAGITGGSLGLVALDGRDVLLVSSNGLWRVPVLSAIRAWSV